LKPFGVIKKIRGKYHKQWGGFTSSLPIPIEIFFGQGFGEGSLYSEYWGIVSIPTGAAKAAGHEPRERDEILEFPICRIGLR
jgi:hypothetical protein